MKLLIKSGSIQLSPTTGRGSFPGCVPSGLTSDSQDPDRLSIDGRGFFFLYLPQMLMIHLYVIMALAWGYDLYHDAESSSKIFLEPQMTHVIYERDDSFSSGFSTIFCNDV